MKQVKAVKQTAKPKPKPEVDTRTPSGKKQLPY